METSALSLHDANEQSDGETWKGGDYLLQIRPFCDIVYSVLLPVAMFGWGNGYVGIPEGHPWYGKHYLDLEDVDVHGGITYSEIGTYEGRNYWVIGFDTGHYSDDISTWTKDRVREETINLYQQALNTVKELKK